MTFASLLVHVEPGEEAAGRLLAACALAARLDALLIGVGAAALEMPVIDPAGFVAFDADLISVERKNLEAELDDIAERFRAAATARSLRMDWRSSMEFPADAVRRNARAADLVIIGHGASAATVSPQHAVSASDVVLQAGRPVLIVPPGVTELRLDHAIVAWRNSSEARRAIADALPLLKLAGKVTVLGICEEDQMKAVAAEIEDVAAFLGRHAITAAGEVKKASNEQVADGILGYAEETGSDLIVAGAYGHAPIREWVLGGVTRDLVKKSAIACLLSH